MPRRVSVVLTLVVAVLLGPGFTLAQDDPLQATTRTVNVELILDASGSMAEALPSGETRMTVAKRILGEVIAGLPEREGINVGLRVYGHLGDNTEAGKQVSCRSSELLVPIAGVNKPALIQQVEAMQPTGWTPIAYSLEQAAADFQPGGESVTNAIVLVTDGEETCDPPEQACQAAAALQQAGISVTTHVVGFALTPQQTEQVSCIAEQGGGQLFGADDAAGLGTAIGSALEGVGVSITPVSITPVVMPPVAAPVPLAEIRTLAYHQLTAWTTGANERGEEAPILSDDGQRIAFARAPGTQDPVTPNRVFVMNADGSGEQEVDAYTSLCGCGAMIDLSADGSRIVSTDGVQLRVAEAAGGSGRELLALDSGEINAVRISGDGTTIVFRIYRDTTIRGTSPSQPIARGIYAINADGSGLRQLVGPAQMSALLGVTPEQAPFFGGSSGLDASINGGRIVFTSGTADIDPATGSVREGLFAVNGDGSGLHRLLGPTSTFVQANAISGDGATVAYVTNDFGTGLQEAGVLGFDGGGQRVLTDSTSRHPGTDANLPSGERIQLSQDGSRLLLGSTGLLYDTTTGDVLALGVSAPGFSADPVPLVIDGLYRATMSTDAARVLYAFQPAGEPYQLVRLDLNPADLGEAPALSDPILTPPYILTEGGSTAIVSVRVSTVDPIVRVSSPVLREGLPDANTRTSPLLDDGATGGDAMASDGLFTSDGISTDGDEVLGPRVVRIKAETQAADGLRDATAIDVAPFAVVAEIPAASEMTPTPALPDQVSTQVVPGTPPPTVPPPTVTPPTVTPPSGGDAAALATIAAQATRIAELEAPSGGTPPAVITPPSDLLTPMVSPTVAPPTPTAVGVGTTGTPVTSDFITPDPAECTVTPRTPESLSVAATPDPATVDALAAARIDETLTVPEGAPADVPTTAAVVQTYRLMVACFNAGNDLAAYALWTDEALRQIAAQPPTGEPTPLPLAERSAFRVTEVRVLPDGGLVAVWEERNPGFATILVQILMRQGDRYFVAETVDATMA